MVTCPWCGTSYAAFQSNCDRCGGPLSPPAAAGSAELAASLGDEGVPAPPLPPRPIADSYTWRLMSSDGWGVAGFIFVLIGAIFTLLGGVLTVAIVTAFVGLPFLVLGLALLVGGGAIARTSLQQARQTVAVLRVGQPATGQIASVDENLSVTVNNRHPWKITYGFRVGERDYQGRLTTLNMPGATLQPGRLACVLYLPEAPERNTIYPHP